MNLRHIKALNTHLYTYIDYDSFQRCDCISNIDSTVFSLSGTVHTDHHTYFCASGHHTQFYTSQQVEVAAGWMRCQACVLPKLACICSNMLCG